MNNRGLVDIEILKKDKPDFDGKSGYCYVRGDKIIKIYASEEDKGFYIPLDRTKICDFSKLWADTIVFPQQYIYQNGEIIAEISKYINSKKVYDSFNSYARIKPIIDGYELVRNDLITYSNIDMHDLCYVNILYSNKNGFHLIDTTEWEFKDNSLSINIRRLDSSLISVICEYALIPIHFENNFNYIDENFYKSMNKYGNAGKRLQKNIDMLINDQYNFLELLFAYMEVYRIHYNAEMKSLKGVKEMTKVLKKG